MPYQCEFDSPGKRPVIEVCLEYNDTWCCHGLDKLVSSYSVILQRQVGEDHKAAESERYRDHLIQWQGFGSEYAKQATYEHSDGGAYEMQAGQAHVGEAVFGVNGFVEEDNGD